MRYVDSQDVCDVVLKVADDGNGPMLGFRQVVLTDEEVKTVTETLERHGKVQVHVFPLDGGSGAFWNIAPHDSEVFCELTDFSLMEMRYGMFNVIPQQLHRISKLFQDEIPKVN